MPANNIEEETLKKKDLKGMKVCQSDLETPNFKYDHSERMSIGF